MSRKIAISSTIVSSIIPLFFLLTLGGCLGPDYSSTTTGPSAPEEAANLREREPHYTSHAAAAAKPEIYGSPSTNNSTCTSGRKSCVPSTSGTTC